MLPGTGNAAINFIVCTNAPHVDQRDYLRSDPSSVGLATLCEASAVEVGSVLSDRMSAVGFCPHPVGRVPDFVYTGGFPQLMQ